jgi:hypothetical protein
MGRYRILFLDLSGAVAKTLEREYNDALDALEAAEALAKESTVEVWSGAHRIAHVNAGNRPSTPNDPLPG